MNKKLLYAGLVALGVILVAVIWMLSGSDGGGQRNVKLPDHEFEDWNQPLSNSAALTNEAISLFDEADLLDYDKLLEMVRSGRISLVSELWRLRRKCPKDMSRYDCNIRIRQFILKRYKPPGNERLAELLMKYLRYEEIMSTLNIEEKDATKRYELIRKKRRELFGEDDAKLVFGLQEAQFDYRQNLKSFLEQTKGMSGDKRMQRYEEMRKQAYGDYYAAVLEREPKFTRFDMEMTLRSNDLKALPEDKRAGRVRDLREKYFGKAGADRMAKVDQQIADETKAEEGYRQAARDYEKENAGASPEEREAALQKLRVKYFGDGAAEFARREQARLFQESLKKK